MLRTRRSLLLEAALCGRKFRQQDVVCMLFDAYRLGLVLICICSHSFSNRETSLEVFLEMQKEYYDRLDCRYDGPCLEADPETLFELADSFSFDKKLASTKRREAAQSKTDYGTTRRVDPDGQARARKDAQSHFGVDNKAKGRKIKGRRQTRPPPGAWADAPSAMNFDCDAAEDDQCSGGDGKDGEGGAKKRGRPKGKTNKKAQAEEEDATRVIGAVSQVGLFKKWVLFRYADDIYVSKKHEKEGPTYPLLCGYVTAIAKTEGSAGKLNLTRCTGDAGDLKEPWALCIERHDLEVQATGDPKRPFQLRRKPFGCHPAVGDYEKKTHHSSYHMTFELRKRLVDKWGSKSAAKWPRSYTYLDFNNPAHKFVLLHEDAQFTSTQHLQASTLKDLVRRNDPLIVKELERTAEEFKGVTRPAKKKAKVVAEESDQPPAPASAKVSSKPSRQAASDSDDSSDEKRQRSSRARPLVEEFDSEDDESEEGILSDSEELQMMQAGCPIEDFCRARKLPNEDFWKEALEKEFELAQRSQVVVYEPSSSASSSSSSATCSSSSVVNEYRSKSKSTKKVVVSDDD